MGSLTPHEYECAMAAIAALLERAATKEERRELRNWLREIRSSGRS